MVVAVRKSARAWTAVVLYRFGVRSLARAAINILAPFDSREVQSASDGAERTRLGALPVVLAARDLSTAARRRRKRAWCADGFHRMVTLPDLQLALGWQAAFESRRAKR